MSWIGDFFSKLFGKKTPAQVIQITPAPPVVVAPLPAPPTVPAPTSGGHIPTREEFVAAMHGLIDGKIPNGLTQPYKDIRELHNDNRSKDIDTIIRAEGGGLGESYCMYGSQHLLDRLCLHFGADRKKVRIPEGGGTQDIAAQVHAQGKYVVPVAVAGGWVIWQHMLNTAHGHVESTLTHADQPQRPYHYDTFGFNTSGDSSSGVVPNGQGCYYRHRSSEQVGDMKVRVYVDIYQAVVDAMSAK